MQHSEEALERAHDAVEDLVLSLQAVDSHSAQSDPEHASGEAEDLAYAREKFAAAKQVDDPSQSARAFYVSSPEPKD